MHVNLILLLGQPAVAFINANGLIFLEYVINIKKLTMLKYFHSTLTIKLLYVLYISNTFNNL